MRLLFILSLPRSGSTLLARTLVTHPAITSASYAEPHLFVAMLGPLAGMKTLSVYGAEIAMRSALDYLGSTVAGVAGCKTAVAGTLERIALSSATDPEACWFMEKTTRNSLIASELVDTLPEARFVILWRNPLDVMASVYRTWCDDRWTWTANSVELFTGLEQLAALQADGHDRVTSLRYEDLVTNPQSALGQLSEFLGVDAAHWARPQELSDVRFEGPHDPNARDTVNQAAHAHSVEKWRSAITTRRRRRMARRYLDWIGPDRLAAMGYDYVPLRAELDAMHPPFLASVAEDLRMEALSLRRIAGVAAFHGLNEARGLGRNALR